MSVTAFFVRSCEEAESPPADGSWSDPLENAGVQSYPEFTTRDMPLLSEGNLKVF
jgi:hypothetical protein